MKTRRAFQIVLAVLATLAALAFCATAIFVLVPLATGHKLPFLGEVVDGIYKIFATQYLSTTQVVIAESFILAPLILAAIAAILLVLTLLINLASEWVGRYFRRKKEL